MISMFFPPMLGFVCIVFFLILALIILIPISFIIAIRSKKKKWKIITIISSISIVILIIIAGIWYELSASYEINIQRIYQNEDEKKAIDIVESKIDYTNITSINRTRFDYYYNFVDETVINECVQEIEQREKGHIRGYISLDYIIEARSTSKCSVKYDGDKFYFNGDNFNESNFFLFEHDSTVVAILNDTWYDVYHSSANISILKVLYSDTFPEVITMDFTEVIFVKIDFSFSGNYIKQYIILNKDFKPIYIAIEPSHVVS